MILKSCTRLHLMILKYSKISQTGGDTLPLDPSPGRRSGPAVSPFNQKILAGPVGQIPSAEILDTGLSSVSIKPP